MRASATNGEEDKKQRDSALSATGKTGRNNLNNTV